MNGSYVILAHEVIHCINLKKMKFTLSNLIACL